MGDNETPTGGSGDEFRPRKPEKKKIEPPKLEIRALGGGEIPPEIAGLIGGLFGGGSPFSGSACTCPRCKPSIDDGAEVANRANSLRSLAASMDVEYDYKVGDIVRHKAGLNLSRITTMGIVRQITPRDAAPYHQTDDASIQTYREKLDVVIGVIVDQGVFLEYYQDGRRLERVPDDELN